MRFLKAIEQKIAGREIERVEVEAVRRYRPGRDAQSER
jgi:hypothetical protein